MKENCKINKNVRTRQSGIKEIREKIFSFFGIFSSLSIGVKILSPLKPKRERKKKEGWKGKQQQQQQGLLVEKSPFQFHIISCMLHK